MDEKIVRLVKEAEERTLYAVGGNKHLLAHYATVCRDVLALCAAVRVLNEERERERTAWSKYAASTAYLNWVEEMATRDSGFDKTVEGVRKDVEQHKMELSALGVPDALFV